MSRFVNVLDYIPGDARVMDITVRDRQRRKVNVTTAVVTWIVARKIGPDTLAAPIVSLSSAGVSPKITFPDAANGRIRVVLDAGMVTAAGEYEHRLRIEMNGQARTVARGRFVAKAPA